MTPLPGGAPSTPPMSTAPPWTGLSVEEPADNRALAATALVAAATDVAVRAGVDGLAGATLVAVVAGSLLASRRLVNRQAQAAMLVAPIFGMWLAARSSPWLLALDAVSVAALLLLGTSLSRGGSILDLHIPGLFRRCLHAVAHGAAGPLFMLGRVRLTRSRRGLAVLRGLILATPLVLVLGLLLSSADAVFASFFRLPLDPLSLAEHGLALALGAWVMAGLLRLSSAAPLGHAAPRPARLGRAETLTVLACLDGLYTAFAVAQLVALSSGGKRVIETAGLTYADYARNGFFQLLAVAGLTLAVLLALATSRPGVGSDFEGQNGNRSGWPTPVAPAAFRRAFVVLAEVAIGLTLVIVVVALRRLHLYEQAFGLTMLRLYSSVFATWIAAAFVLLGLVVAGFGRGRSWFVPAAATLGLAGVLTLNAVNPEALVVRHNVTHAERTGRFDADYAARLSADAVPALTAALPRLDHLDPDTMARVLADLCAPRPRVRGWLSYNASFDAAVEARNRVCP
ncbi:MAG: DUF4173 domain-containing protein [Actinomycetota bacterium]|nr:DUF4173 domain-containing protein [Actinomycetota bacterium]